MKNTKFVAVPAVKYGAMNGQPVHTDEQGTPLSGGANFKGHYRNTELKV
jgi:hypothetical protein